MAVSLFDVTSQYGLLKQIASHLWLAGVITLAKTSEILGDQICGDLTRYWQLIGVTLSCSGAFQQEWREDIGGCTQVLHPQLDRPRSGPLGPYRFQHISTQHRDLTMAQVKCQSAVKGPKASRPCGMCGEAVCNGCRLHLNYTVRDTNTLIFVDEKIIDLENNNCTQVEDDHSRPRHEVYVWPLEQLFLNRFVTYCWSCCEHADTSRPSIEANGHPKICECTTKAISVKLLQSWTCLLCFKRLCADAQRSAAGMCANATKLPSCECVGEDGGLVCHFCNGVEDGAMGNREEIILGNIEEIVTSGSRVPTRSVSKKHPEDMSPEEMQEWAEAFVRRYRAEKARKEERKQARLREREQTDAIVGRSRRRKRRWVDVPVKAIVPNKKQGQTVDGKAGVASRAEMLKWAPYLA